MTDSAREAPSDIPAHYRNKGDLTKGNIARHMARLSIPMSWGILTIISVQLVDTYFVSLLGTEPLAGISFTFPVTLVVSHIVFGMNIAMSSVVARLIGESKMGDVRRIAQHGLFLCMLVSASFAVMTYLSLEPLFRMLGADEVTLPYIYQYMPLWLLSSVIVSIHSAGNSVMRAAGTALYPAITMSFMALLNLILDPILIFGLLGAPAMGVQGAAAATLIANLIAGSGGFWILAMHKKLVCLDSLHLDKVKDSLRRLMIIAIPAGIGNIIQPATGAIILAVIATNGPEAVAAFGVATRVEAFALVVVIGLALGMSPIIGQNWGAGNIQRVRATIKTAIGFNMLWSLFVAIILGVFAKDIAGAFSANPDIITIASLFFYIVPISFGFGNLVNGWASAFNAIGKPQKAFALIVIKAFFFSVPAVFIGNMMGGLTGIFYAIAAANIISGMLCHIWARRACFQT